MVGVVADGVADQRDGSVMAVVLAGNYAKQMEALGISRAELESRAILGFGLREVAGLVGGQTLFDQVANLTFHFLRVGRKWGMRRFSDCRTTCCFTHE